MEWDTDDDGRILKPVHKTLQHMNEAELRIHAGFIEAELLAEKRTCASALEERQRLGEAWTEAVRLRNRDLEEYRKEVAFQKSLAHLLGLHEGAAKEAVVEAIEKLQKAANVSGG